MHIAFKLSLPDAKRLEREMNARHGTSASLVAKALLLELLNDENQAFLVTTLEEVHEQVASLEARLEKFHRDFLAAVERGAD